MRFSSSLFIMAAVLMSWLPQPTLRRRYEATWEALAALYPGRRRAGRTLAGYSKATLRQSPRLLRWIEHHLRDRMPDLLQTRWRCEGFATFTVDGTRVATPRTVANEALGTGGKERGMPQLTLTTMLHMASGAPWDYRVGPAAGAERAHLRSMIASLPAEALLVADAGFTGYELLSQLIAGGRHVLIRAGANVPLLTELGCDGKETKDTVYLWPKNRRRRGLPLRLRLIRVTVRGSRDGGRDGGGGRRGQRRGRSARRKHRVKSLCLLTDLPAGQLSRAAASRLYRRRWGIESFYCNLKKTMSKQHMLSRSPALAALELRWSMIGLWLLRLLNALAMIEHGGDPLRGSVAQSLDLMRHHVRQLRQPGRPRWHLWSRLSAARQDDYVRRRSKANRAYPRQKQSAPPCEPKVRRANRAERAAAQHAMGYSGANG